MISCDYKPEEYRLPLTPEQEAYLIEQATLEELMRNPQYDYRQGDAYERYHAALTEGLWWDLNAPLGAG